MRKFLFGFCLGGLIACWHFEKILKENEVTIDEDQIQETLNEVIEETKAKKKGINQ